MGLDKCRRLFVGAAPISPDTLKYYMSLDMCLQEAFGLTESAGPQIISPFGGIRLGSCGKTLEGTELKIVDPDEDGVGEVNAIFLSYIKLVSF